MAGPIHKDNDIGLAPADMPLRAEYERDFYSYPRGRRRFVNTL